MHVLQVAATPFVKGRQQLEAVALGADVHFEAGAVRRWVLVGVLARVKVSEGKFVSRWRLQLELFSVGCGQVICLWVEVQRAGDGHGSNNLEKRENRKDFNCRFSKNQVVSLQEALQMLCTLLSGHL